MRFAGLKLGFAITGSHCTILEVIPVIKELIEEGADVFPIFSNTVRETDTRFIKAVDFYRQVTELTGHQPWNSLVEVEPIGPKKLLDVLVVAPCTGNTLAKLAHGISDSCVVLAGKAHLRNARPLVLGVSTNDGLATSAHNLAVLLNKKHVYFVPFGQDAPDSKPTSVIAKLNLIPETVLAALEQRQLQPLLITYK